jgi:HEAT repeat protein
VRRFLLLLGLVVTACTTSPIPPTSAPQQAAAPDPLIEKLAAETTKAAARHEILARGPAAVDLLLAHAQHSDGHVRWEIVDLLGTLRDARALPALTDRVLDDVNPHVRWRAMWALSRLATNDEIRERLRPGLDAEGERRWNAAVALSFFEAPDGIAVLHDGVRSPDPFRRWEAINALGRVHDEKTVEVLSMALRSPSARDRNEVVLTLGNIGGPAANAMLVSALSDDAPSVRWRAAMALGKSGTIGQIDALRLVASGDPDGEVREHAAKAIARIEQR